MYIKYANYKHGMQLEENDSVLMSLQEFLNGGKDLEDVPVTITPDGEPPAEETEEESDVSESEEEATE
uniref:Uncharacterized protein n=1 Tax=Myoviridae sp. ct4tH12 TaxID=2825031 RepID=A0A8S5PWY0_9CAUD|nr:MAG TPA: hypothetical protein [Myoviridae sp. ct4tH12]